jgi:hypothetical protein
MNEISHFCLATWLVLVWFAVPTSAFDEQDTKSIDAYIVHQARQEHGEEYKEARRVTNRRSPPLSRNCRTVYDRGPEWNHP